MREKAKDTYESKGVDYKSADSVSEQAEPEDIKVQQSDAQVPDEVAAGQSLDHARGTGVSPDALLKVHGRALLVGVHNP